MTSLFIALRRYRHLEIAATCWRWRLQRSTEWLAGLQWELEK